MFRSLLLLFLVGGCSTADGECTGPGDCQATTTVCAGCPPLAQTLCVDATCVARAADVVDFSATISLDRSFAGDVASFTHTIIDGRGLSCPVDLARSDINVLSTGFKSVSGGSFHPDVNIGRAPAGTFVVVVVATDANAGEGSVLGQGCIDGLSSTGDAISIDLISVE